MDMTEGIDKTIVEAIYGFCCNDIVKISEIKSFICREFINGGLVEAEDRELLSSEVDETIKFLKRTNCLNLVFFEGDVPCFEITRTFSELLNYTIEGVGII